MPVTISGCLVPTAAELHTLQMELFPTYLEGKLGFSSILPPMTSELSEIVLHQPDIFKGMQDFRGLNKPTKHVKERYNPYGTMCKVEPGYWGEHDTIDEEVFTKWGMPGSCNQTLDLTWYTTQLQSRLLERRANRIEYNIWQTLVYGKYIAYNQSGGIIFSQTFNIQNVTAGVSWTNFSGSFPLRDFRAIRLLGRGTSAKFNSCARAIMNQETANLMFANTNPTDIGRIGLSACCIPMSQGQINEQFLAQDLPQVVIYDEGWVDEEDNFNVFIPYGYVIIVGCRPGGVPIGHYWLTRNAVDCSIGSGFWQKLVDTCDREVPRKVYLYDGHNGGPALEYPRALVVLRVA